MTGPAVECVQDALTTRNTVQPYGQRGTFDGTTERYVKAGQLLYEFPQTGWVDRQTGNMMLSDIKNNLGSARYTECYPLLPHL